MPFAVGIKPIPNGDWVNSNGLYQVWDTKKVDGHWYIYKQFTVNGHSYLSRQGFIPQADGTVVRISEKSYDEKTWELRFMQRFKKYSSNFHSQGLQLRVCLPGTIPPHVYFSAGRTGNQFEEITKSTGPEQTSTRG